MMATFLHDVLIPIQKVHRVRVGPEEKLNSLCFDILNSTTSTQPIWHRNSHLGFLSCGRTPTLNSKSIFLKNVITLGILHLFKWLTHVQKAAGHIF